MLLWTHRCIYLRFLSPCSCFGWSSGPPFYMYVVPVCEFAKPMLGALLLFQNALEQAGSYLFIFIQFSSPVTVFEMLRCVTFFAALVVHVHCAKLQLLWSTPFYSSTLSTDLRKSHALNSIQELVVNDYQQFLRSTLGQVQSPPPSPPGFDAFLFSQESEWVNEWMWMCIYVCVCDVYFLDMCVRRNLPCESPSWTRHVRAS